MLQGTSLWGSRFGVQLRLSSFSNISQVAKEAAAAAVLLPSLRPSHCATCLVQLPVHPCLLPCPRCPAVFCGKLCREQTGHALLCRMEHTMDEVLEQVRVNIQTSTLLPFPPPDSWLPMPILPPRIGASHQSATHRVVKVSTSIRIGFRTDDGKITRK